ncbi:MAG: nuclear transport factor 2 family protein [Alphaproteobacteria bacterium]
MIAAPGLDAPLELRLRLADLYAAYGDALDEREWERWPEFFTENCIYKILPRENVDYGLPATMIYCESRAMLADRVVALREALVFAPRLIRCVAGAPCLWKLEPDGMRLRSSFALFETMLNEPSTLFLCGRIYDRVVDDAGVLRFAERIIVTDATNVQLSLVYPI